MTIARLMQMARAGVPAGGGDGDFTSATFVSSFTLPSITNVRGVVVSDDQTKILVNNTSASTNFLVRLGLSTAGDLSTASVENSSSISANTKSNLFLQSPSIIWALDASADTIKKYTLNADFGNTISAVGTTNVPAGVNPPTSDNPNSVTFNDDGSKMFIGDFNAAGVQEFFLGTNYAPNTATYIANGSVASQNFNLFSHCWNNEGTKLYVLQTAGGASVLYQYGLSVGYDVTTMSYDGSLSLTDGPLSSGNALGIAVSSDDLSLYVSGADFTNKTAYIAKYSAT